MGDFNMVVAVRDTPPELMLHFDSAVQYRSGEYHNLLHIEGISPDMSRNSNCWGMPQWNHYLYE